MTQPQQPNGLADLLRDSVPEPPAVAGWGRQVATRGRAARRRRRAVAVVGAVVAVAVVVGGTAALPRGAETDASYRPVVDRLPTPTRVPGCPALGPVHRDFRTGQATSVRFCSPIPGSPNAAVSSAVLRGTAALAMAARWQAGATTAAPSLSLCPVPGSNFAVAVTFDDGTVTEARGQAGSCGTRLDDGALSFAGGYDTFSELTRAIAAQRARTYPPLPLPTLGCPTDSSEAVSLDGASSGLLRAGGPLLELPAIAAVVCRFPRSRPPRVETGTLSSEQAENRRVAAAACPSIHGSRGLPRRIRHLIVLRDQTGTTRSYDPDDRAFLC